MNNVLLILISYICIKKINLRHKLAIENNLILVIDKDPDISTVIFYVLIEDGLECINYSGEFDVLKINSFGPALMIVSHDISTDINEFCRSVKIARETCHFPVILTSTQPTLSKIAKNSNADAFLHKPFDIDELSILVKQVMETSR